MPDSPSTPKPVTDAEQPEPAADAPDGVEPAADTVVAPLNRAERRAKPGRSDPSHVGPRAGRSAPGRSGRSHTKRQIG